MYYKISDLVSQIAKLSLKKGETIMVHSALHSFGMPAGVRKAKLCSVIYQQLRSMVGEEGTIAVPTFNFTFCSGRLYDIKHTPSQGMGVFSEYIRRLENSMRSKHPTQSICAVGKNAKVICSTDTYSAFARGSSFAKLVELDATVLLIGAPIQAVSFIHLAEENCAVPYRYYKTFSADYRDFEGKVTEKKYGMYVRNLDINPILKMSKVERSLQEKGQIEKNTFNSGKISKFKVTNFLDVVNEKLKKDPYWLIKD